MIGDEGSYGPSASAEVIDAARAYSAPARPFRQQQESEADPTPPENLYESWQEATEALRQMVVSLSDEPPALPQMYVSTPGVGKTRAGLHLARLRAMRDDHIVYASPSRDMMWQCYDRLAESEYMQKAIILEGRHPGYERNCVDDYGFPYQQEVEPNCVRYDKVEMAMAKGYPPHAFVCARCHRFPFAEDQYGDKVGFAGACHYYKRKWQACGYVPFPSVITPVILTTHHMVANLIGDGRAMNPDWVIIDEDPVSALRDTIEWTESELARPVDGEPYVALRRLLSASVSLADRFRLLGGPAGSTRREGALSAQEQLLLDALRASKEFGSTCLWGERLVLVLESAAQAIGINLDETLENAMHAPSMVDQGGFMSMSATRYDRLPHYRESDLAAALVQVVRQARSQDDRAYRVSMRWSPEMGWSVVYDYVRRLNYDGNLVLLDAYGDETLAERYTGTPVDKHEVRCKVRPNITVKRYPNVRTSRTAMEPEEKRDRLFQKYVAPELQHLQGKKVLFYTQKRFSEWLRDRVGAEPVALAAAGYKWWWMDRGDDNYRDYDAMVVVGSPYPNVVAERHFANALFAGETPLDWTDQRGNYIDPRVRANVQARREKELYQALFRLRLANPHDKAQTIIVFSAMNLPVEVELPGAVDQMKSRFADQLDEDVERLLSEDVMTMFKEHRCWMDVMSAFVFLSKELKAWREGDGEMPISYSQLQSRVQTIRNIPLYDAIKRNVLERVLGVTSQHLLFRGRQVRYWGDKDAAYALLSRLADSMREPGCDDEPVSLALSTTAS